MLPALYNDVPDAARLRFAKSQNNMQVMLASFYVAGGNQKSSRTKW